MISDSMRVALCTARIGGRGGQEVFLRRLARHLSEKGHEVRVLTVRDSPAIDGVEVVRVRPPCPAPRSLRDWMSARTLARALEHFDGDTALGAQKTWGCPVIRLGGGSEAAYWEMRATYHHGRGPAATALETLRSRMSLKRKLDIATEIRALHHPALRRVIVNSKRVAEHLAERYPECAGRTQVLYNGVDTARFHPVSAPEERAALRRELGLDPDTATAVFSGHDFRRKGLPELIRALARLRAVAPDGPDVQLLVLGGGEPAPMRRLARRLGIAPLLRFAGNVSNLPAYYNAGDFLAFPTHYDPFASVTLEALACGLPVLTTRLNGAAELIRPGKEGFLIDRPGDLDAMARALRSLADPRVRSALRPAALALAQRHTLVNTLDGIENLLQQCRRRK